MLELFPLDRSAFILALCDFCHARPLYHRTDGSMAERDLTAREDRFIGLCLGPLRSSCFRFHRVVLVGTQWLDELLGHRYIRSRTGTRTPYSLLIAALLVMAVAPASDQSHRDTY